MSDSPFKKPSAGGDKFDPRDGWLGALLIIYPKAYTKGAETKHGDANQADCDIIVVDRADPATGKPAFFHRARLFGNLADSVQDSVADGSPVLGRLGQGPNTKGNPPWILIEVEDGSMDEQMAVQAHQGYLAGQFKPPADPAAATATDPWAGMNVQTSPPAAAAAAPTPAPTLAPAIQAAAAAAAAPAGDPNVGFLISKGLDPQKVLAMDPATRAAVAAQL